MSLKSLKTCLNFSLCLFLLLLLQPAAAQSDFSGASQLLEKNKKMLGNGVVALVWKDGKIIYQKEIGAPEFTAKTQAPIAASSQWLTSALIMTFVDQGKISLDDPVAKYIPVLEKYLKGYITIRECLGHTTGIENSKSGIGKILERKKYESLEAEANAIAAKEIGNNPSKEFFYGNVGLNLASRVIEIVGKKSFDRLMQERITRPLKMRGTNFTDENGNAPNPSAGGISTANDYINFLVMLLNKGTFEGKRILSEAAIAEMEKNQFPGLPVKYVPKAAEGFEYGMGVWIQEKDGSGNATVISCPGLFGVTAYIDRCRKYAAVIFTKTTLSEQKKDLAQQFKDAVDSEVGECK
jgi:CubicO group peptidase (beta-lactamase class C family)